MAPPSGPDSRSAFFYGTLMAPQVLSRVCHGQKSNTNNNNPTFRTHPAILHNYRRHRVRHADYPGILPCAHASVRGTYVTNLTDADIWRLDIFEGDQYAREVVRVRLLLADDAGSAEGEEVVCETYVWIAGAAELEDGEWDFEQFRREKMRFWVGAEGEGEYAGRPSIIGWLVLRVGGCAMC
ncbi:AIG2-like family-domain-containing protein [Neohortaea acidophila]|uniref:Putative gamma-glutamylcyclotransferase n=1 Tax=Neohortaea acidophila TaxID=245834 RepID=A0A6A6PUA6_9PEZI|nr:AIG2-like family-domain-containing protein [Neohortaea acidophila]KAF2483670.1 AIG2-like family-domain-containing protein [Neohortaea acidophila]